jgi:hypothetical protein
MKMKNMSKKEAKNPEHYLGYVMSILSDEINHLKFRRCVANLKARDVV